LIIIISVVAAIPNPPQVEVIVNETIISPELPIITPVEVIVEEPIEVIVPPPPPSLIPVIPEVPEVSVLIKDLPPAPILPPLVLPKIPVWVEESVEVVPPCEEKEIIITEVKPLPPVVIPQPPSLPPLVLPPKISVSEIEIKSQQPVDTVVEVPLVPKKDISMEYSKVKLTNEESLQVIPSSVAEIDFKINEIPSSIEFPDFDKLLSVGEDKTVIMVPPSPELPVIEIPKPISEVLLIEKDKELVLPTQIPTDCARNIVLERVLPNMISKKTVTKSLEIISFPAAKYPVIAPLFPAL
ncbi:titin-like, partial [Manduca sexta]|uniref:titin-like n=1 Tax=Manduca sexta TaxID=7130 RepID=UPI0011832CB0